MTTDDAYRAVLEDLFRLRRFGVKLDVLTPRRALERLGDPVATLPAIQIAGTNGKGSVAAILAAILRAAGHRTGLYTSPHLNRFTERVRIDGAEISRAEVVGHYRRVREVAPELTFFEVATALAALAFADRGVDIAVVEVGLGGRLDATNVFSPVATGITPISREHTAYLGHGLERIAWEKGMVMRPRIPCATSAIAPPAVVNVLRRLAAVKTVPLAELGRDFRVTAADDATLAYHDASGELAGLRLGLRGAYQRDNAALALALARALPARWRPGDDACRDGLAAATWPGRQELRAGSPAVLLDVAHNPAAAQSLAQALAAWPAERRWLVFGAMGDKDLLGTLRPLLQACDGAWLTGLRYYRSADPAALKRRLEPTEQARVQVAHGAAEAFAHAHDAAGRGDLIVVAGSVFLVGEVRGAVWGEPSDPVYVTDPVASPTYSPRSASKR